MHEAAVQTCHLEGVNASEMKTSDDRLLCISPFESTSFPIFHLAQIPKTPEYEDFNKLNRFVNGSDDECPLQTSNSEVNRNQKSRDALTADSKLGKRMAYLREGTRDQPILIDDDPVDQQEWSTCDQEPTNKKTRTGKTIPDSQSPQAIHGLMGDSAQSRWRPTPSSMALSLNTPRLSVQQLGAYNDILTDTLIDNLAGITGNRPEALVELRYRHLKLTLIRDPDGGGRPRLFVELTPEFTKGFLGSKDVNEFKIPEIIYDPTLVLSPHVFLLGMLFKARAFKSLSIDYPERLYSLKVLKGLNEQLLPLRDEMNDEFIFYEAYRMKVGGEITGFSQVLKPYNLRDGAAKGLNESHKCPILYYPSIILTQGLLNSGWRVLKAGHLKGPDADLSNAPVGARKDNRLQKAIKRLYNEKQRKRRELLKDIKERYKTEQPVKDSERQLSGIVVDKDTRDALVGADMSLEQLSLIDAILTLPGKLPEQELQRRITAINAVTLYCGVEEGAPSRYVRLGPPGTVVSPPM
ncbi:hypothetical protein BKA64DRAFT_648481 [Cadophora sp. MPI-SDFR-AT-0126]|nr:hypothetical protein BKA64DRAFT_648481 [Leotiomycetes sp. MPI-SDFR-AT-0126]